MLKDEDMADRFPKPEAGEPSYYYIDDVSVLVIDISSFSTHRVSKGMYSQVRELQDTIFTALNRKYYWNEANPRKPSRVILIPTGDGYVIAFHKVVDRRVILKHVDCLYKELVLRKQIKLRFGLSRGPHQVFVDLNGVLNLTGEGIIRAQRATMVANDGQVFCTSEFVEGIETEIGGSFKEIAGLWRVKKERPFRLFNYRNGSVGRTQKIDEKFSVRGCSLQNRPGQVTHAPVRAQAHAQTLDEQKLPGTSHATAALKRQRNLWRYGAYNIPPAPNLSVPEWNSRLR